MKLEKRKQRAKLKAKQLRIRRGQRSNEERTLNKTAISFQRSMLKAKEMASKMRKHRLREL